jgi:hypothetical protein
MMTEDQLVKALEIARSGGNLVKTVAIEGTNYSGIAAIHSNEGTVLVNANGDVMVGGRP